MVAMPYFLFVWNDKIEEHLADLAGDGVRGGVMGKRSSKTSAAGIDAGGEAALAEGRRGVGRRAGVEIVDQGRAVLSARKVARQMLGELKAERERRGLSLADMMRLTGMSRESISRLENDPAPNPTMLTFARYAAALGLRLQFSATKGS